jgi:hypothetical protein
VISARERRAVAIDVRALISVSIPGRRQASGLRHVAENDLRVSAISRLAMGWIIDLTWNYVTLFTIDRPEDFAALQMLLMRAYPCFAGLVRPIQCPRRRRVFLISVAKTAIGLKRDSHSGSKRLALTSAYRKNS